jgi:hypothetical protein
MNRAFEQCGKWSAMRTPWMLCGAIGLVVLVWLIGCGGDDDGGPSGPNPSAGLVAQLEWTSAGDLDLSATTPNGSVSGKAAAPDPGCAHGGDNLGSGTGPFVETFTCGSPTAGNYDIAVNNSSANPIDYTLTVTRDGVAESGFPVSQSVAGGAQADHSFTITPPLVPCPYCSDRPDGIAVRIHVINVNAVPDVRVTVDNVNDTIRPICTMYYCGGDLSCFEDDSGASACHDGQQVQTPCNDRCEPKIYALDTRPGELGQAWVYANPGDTIALTFSGELDGETGIDTYTASCVLADDIHTASGGQAFTTFYVTPAPTLVCESGFATP